MASTMPSDMSADVVVVGAGPGGSSTAYHLARAGLDVVLLEKSPFPRDKICGDGLTPAAVHELIAMGVDTTGWMRNRGLTVIGGGHTVHMDWPDQKSLPGYGMTRARMELDHALVQRAVEAGARQVQGCVNGFGERTGNANILTLIADLELKTGWSALPGDGPERARRLAELSAVSRTVGEIADRAPSGRLPYVGTRAFAHKAGLHASAIRVDPDLYQHVDPARVGNTMTMLVSEMAGRASIELKARELGIDTGGDAALLARVTEAVKAREALGYAYDAADGSFELLLRAALGELPEYFRVESWRASIQARPLPGERLLPLGGDTPTDSEATVRLWVGGRRRAVLGEGNGPVNALDHALCEALAQTYPEIRAFELTDFKVRILDSERGTRSIVRVLIDITDGERTWSTVGVGTDIIEASWEALTDGHTVGLLRAGVVPR